MTSRHAGATLLRVLAAIVEALGAGEVEVAALAVPERPVTPAPR